jgi:uncharacterized protein (AIM24 family)
MRSDIFSNVEQAATEPGFAMQNSKLLKVTVNGGSFYARRGAMVAYQGSAQFEYQGALAGDGSVKDKLFKAAKGAVSGEGVPLMKVSGQAEVFLADDASDIFLIDLDGSDALSINGANVLAFESSLQYDIKMLTNAGVFAGAGLFNTIVYGQGRVAITSRGTPVVLETAHQPSFVDPNAAICWSANLQVSVQRSEGVGGLIGRSSGEALQMQFAGPGFVAVQPSEHTAGIGQTGASQNSGGALGGLLGGR